jgi:predicted nucleotidyltransferase
MPLPESWVARIIEWAEGNGTVQEVGLFGSRARGTEGPDSDVDLAIVLSSGDGKTNLPLYNYTKHGDKWQKELAALVGRSVSLEIKPANLQDYQLLWRRDEE